MILKFFYRTADAANDPLVASAFIPGDGNQSYPWPEGEIEYYPVDLKMLAGDLSRRKKQDQYFRETLREELRQHRIVTRHESLKPWTRLAFENIHEFGINLYHGLAYARLYEDDVTEFDPANAIPLYDPDFRPASTLPFEPPGQNPEEIAVEQTFIEEMRQIHQHKKRAEQQHDSGRATEADAELTKYKQGIKERDPAKLAEARAWLQSAKDGGE